MTSDAKHVPPSVSGAAEKVRRKRGQTARLKRFFDHSPVPMVMADDQRRLVEANRPARLVLRLSLAEMRGYTAEDLSPPHALPTLKSLWAQMLDSGSVTGGPFEVAAPDGCPFEVVYYGLADALPGLHLFAFSPAGWPEDELGLLEDESADRPRAPLTDREREVLQLAARGLSRPSIAEQLFIRPATVKSHFAHIYEKLGVRNRAGAVATGMRLGVID